jgi:Transposase DNA-binding/Transposase DDE domain
MSILATTVDSDEDTFFGTDSWAEEKEFINKFKDARLGKRFQSLLKQLSNHMGESIPLVCQDWANTKAAYRFLSNNRVSEKEILEGHFHTTRTRFAATEGLVLVLQDTTEFSYQREKPELIGSINLMKRKYKDGRPQFHTTCGILVHSSLVFTTEGLPLGLAAIKFWTRKKFKGSNELKKKINPTSMPIEEKESVKWLENLKYSTHLLNNPSRCVHVGDRESDIYELFCLAHEENTHFVIRTCVDRLAEDGSYTIIKEMDKIEIKGFHSLKVRNKNGEENDVTLSIKYHYMKILPPIGKSKKYPALWVTIIHATEHMAPSDRDAINWKLITSLPIHSLEDAIEKLQWYAQRWKIETFHKILKSGCKAESSKLRTAERLVNLISIFCILSWRIFLDDNDESVLPRRSTPSSTDKK